MLLIKNEKSMIFPLTIKGVFLTVAVQFRKFQQGVKEKHPTPQVGAPFLKGEKEEKKQFHMALT
jgi:hypothetical protein